MRMGGQVPKQFMELAGEPIVVRTLRRFEQLLPDARIVLVLPEAHLAALPPGGHVVCAGGATRFDSVRAALAHLTDMDLIVVHDGVRPLFSERVLREVIEAAAKTGAAIPVVEPVDSLRHLTPDGSEPIDRAEYRAVQTPQAFQAKLLQRAYAQPCRPEFTDDASVVERLGAPIALVTGERRNIKITTPDDLLIAEILLNHGTL